MCEQTLRGVLESQLRGRYRAGVRLERNVSFDVGDDMVALVEGVVVRAILPVTTNRREVRGDIRGLRKTEILCDFAPNVILTS